MLDINYLRQNPDLAKKKIAQRGYDAAPVELVLSLDEKRRSLLSEAEALRSRRNEAAKNRDIEGGKNLKDELGRIEEQLKSVTVQFETKMLELPNIALEDVPVGAPSAFKVLELDGEPTKFSFTPKDHLELGEKLGIIDTFTASKVSGSRFAYLKDKAAILEMALVRLSWDRLIPLGFTPVIPPALIRKDITSKLGYWQSGGNENYYFVRDYQTVEEQEKDNDLYLIGTGEHSVVPMFENELLSSGSLPRRFVAYSPCFRREAGTYGKDTRGIFRVHQFDKVEMVSFVLPEEDQAEFELLLNSSWGLMGELGLPVRKVALTTEDLSTPAAKTIDIETWFPSQNSYRETHSISTTTDFQARRLNTRYQSDGKTDFVHILNGTSFAVGRTIAAILENNQREDGSVEIPEVLRAYTGFSEINVK